VRQTVCHVVEPVPAQADAPEPGLAVGQAVQRVRKAVRQHARARHAPADAQADARVRRVRKDVQPAVAAAGPPPVAHRRETVRMRALRQSFCRPLEPARAHADPLRRQKLCLPAVFQVVCSQVIPEQASGIGLLARRHRRGRAFVSLITYVVVVVVVGVVFVFVVFVFVVIVVIVGHNHRRRRRTVTIAPATTSPTCTLAPSSTAASSSHDCRRNHQSQLVASNGIAHCLNRRAARVSEILVIIVNFFFTI